MIIRQYKSIDKKEVFDLHVKALKHANAYMYCGKWDEDFNDNEGIYLHNSGDFLVGLLNNKIIAMGALRKMTDDIVELRRMRVDPAHQRKGYGQKMLDVLEKRAKELGYKIIQLNTSEKQVPAQKLYEKNGYKEISREKEGWIVDNIIYQKNIK
jgi:ribosomal protein S18 acetylase RimI-like enzyme